MKKEMTGKIKSIKEQNNNADKSTNKSATSNLAPDCKHELSPEKVATLEINSGLETKPWLQGETQC